MIQAIFYAAVVALASLVGALFFGHDKRLSGAERLVIPAAVGVFLSLILYELLPATLSAAPLFGGLVVFGGYIFFYVLAHFLHTKNHEDAGEHCRERSSANLYLIGDVLHNITDGLLLGSAFLIDTHIGVAAALGLAIHKLPQEIIAFGIFIRGGYTRLQAAYFNLLSGAGVILGTICIYVISEHAAEYTWVFAGLVAGNLLYLSTSDMLPRIHGELSGYKSIWLPIASIITGFVIMTGVLLWTHEQIAHPGHDHHAEDGHHIEDEHHDETDDSH